jgi:hypothetical protein
MHISYKFSWKTNRPEIDKDNTGMETSSTAPHVKILSREAK